MHRIAQFKGWLSCTLMLLSFWMILPNAVQAEAISFGVVPQQSARKLAQTWVPILNYLSAKTGDTYNFVTATDIPTFEKRLLAGDYDVAYMNPYHYVVFEELAGYKAFAKQAEKSIVGMLVVHKDSQISELSDLNNLPIAFPSPAAFAASVLPRAELKRRGINFTPKYVSSHDSVYLNVAKGFFPAGGGIGRTLNNFNPDLREDIRVLWKTEGYTPHAFAASASISGEAVARLQAAMVAMHTDPEGAMLLDKIGFKGIESASDKDWDDIRALNLTALDELVQ